MLQHDSVGEAINGASFRSQCWLLAAIGVGVCGDVGDFGGGGGGDDDYMLPEDAQLLF